MENPANWTPLHHAIADVIKNNEEPAVLSYELVSTLKSARHLPKSSDDDELVQAFDETVWEHEASMKKGICGHSLVWKLGQTVEKLSK